MSRCLRPARRSFPSETSKSTSGPTICRIAARASEAAARQGLEDEFLAPNGAWEIEGEPYVSAPGSTFRWFRSRIVGGRTNHWGRIALRMAPVDFKVRSHDGMGDDWPISYEDVAPYYDKVESYIGVFGTKENIPSAPDGIFLPPPKPRCTETIIKKACDKLKHPVHSVAPGDPDPAAQRPRRLPLLRAMRPRMHHRLQLQLQPGHDSARGRDRAFHADHRRHGARTHRRAKTARSKPFPTSTKPLDEEKRIHARAFVVAASACESARLLLNSQVHAVSQTAWPTPPAWSAAT